MKKSEIKKVASSIKSDVSELTAEKEAKKFRKELKAENDYSTDEVNTILEYVCTELLPPKKGKRIAALFGFEDEAPKRRERSSNSGSDPNPRTSGTGYHVRKQEDKKGRTVYCITKEEKVGKGKNAEIEEVVVDTFKEVNAARIELRRILRNL